MYQESTARRVIYQGKVVDLGLETAHPPRGTPFELELVRHPGGAAVVALNAQGQVGLIYQFRHAAGGWIWEIPAGKLEPGEPPQATAHRELEEEIGARAEQWDCLGTVLSTPGFCDEVIHLFLARDIQSVPPRPEPNEYLETRWIALDTALEWVLDNTIQDAKTIAGLFRARYFLDGPNA